MEYTDFIKENNPDRFNLITTKSLSYKYEEELRLFIVNVPLSEGGTQPPYEIQKGRYVSVDVDSLVDRIYVSPFAGPWFVEALKEVLLKVRPSMVEKVEESLISDS